MTDGTLSYPLIEEKDINSNTGKGMSFELRYIGSSHHQYLASLFVLYIYNLLGTSRSLIQVAKNQRLLLTTLQ